MQPVLWIKYLFGQAEAIRRVAGSRAAVWTGLVLVLLTSIARNYDQTLIAEKPFLWFFGSLLFSFFSASWLYLATYKTFARRSSSGLGDLKPSERSAWPSFLGLFWMTAPIAWLYAIPVERFMDSISATQANLALLGIVSLWRVLLMARVLQVTTKAPFLMALCWVLFAAAVEVLVLFFFGDGLAKRVMQGMGGMRNSPEEEIMMRAMGSASSVGLMIAPVAFVVSLLWRPKQLLQPLPVPSAEPMRSIGLSVAAVFWIVVAVMPQRELANTVAVEKLMKAERTREALDYLAARQPSDFAPARTLPPKPYEREVFTQLPACFNAVQTNDPPWVRALLLTKLDAMMSHLGPRWRRRATDNSQPREERIKTIQEGIQWHGPYADGLQKLLDGLLRIPEGGAWLSTNEVFVEAIWQAAGGPHQIQGGTARSEAEQRADWMGLATNLGRHFLTNGVMILTNQPPSTATPPP